MLNVKTTLTKILEFVKRKDYKTIGTTVNIINYNSSSNMYTVPSDGYVKIQCTYRSNSYIMLMREDGDSFAQCSSAGTVNMGGNIACSTPVFKGMKVYITSNTQYNTATFTPFET